MYQIPRPCLILKEGETYPVTKRMLDLTNNVHNIQALTITGFGQKPQSCDALDSIGELEVEERDTMFHPAWLINCVECPAYNYKHSS